MWIKIKNWFQSKKINLNLIIILLILIGGIVGFLLYTNYQSKKESTKIENVEKEIIEKSTTRIIHHTYRVDSINNSIDKDYEKINQNEKVDWSDVYTADPDSIAKDILKWHHNRK